VSSANTPTKAQKPITGTKAEYGYVFAIRIRITEDGISIDQSPAYRGRKIEFYLSSAIIGISIRVQIHSSVTFISQCGHICLNGAKFPDYEKLAGGLNANDEKGQDGDIGFDLEHLHQRCEQDQDSLSSEFELQDGQPVSGSSGGKWADTDNRR
jgi:hypothetical protein